MFNKKKIKELQEQLKQKEKQLSVAQIQKQQDNETIRKLKAIIEQNEKKLDACEKTYSKLQEDYCQLEEEKKNAVNELKEISLELRRLQRAAGDKEKQPQVACYVSVFEPADVASLTGISKGHIAEWARRNNVRRYGKGKRTCYDKVDVIDALKTWKR